MGFRNEFGLNVASGSHFDESENNRFDAADKFRKPQFQKENGEGYAAVMGLGCVTQLGARQTKRSIPLRCIAHFV